jgi:hypothetical protein
MTGGGVRKGGEERAELPTLCKKSREKGRAALKDSADSSDNTASFFSSRTERHSAWMRLLRTLRFSELGHSLSRNWGEEVRRWGGEEVGR